MFYSQLLNSLYGYSNLKNIYPMEGLLLMIIFWWKDNFRCREGTKSLEPVTVGRRISGRWQQIFRSQPDSIWQQGSYERKIPYDNDNKISDDSKILDDNHDVHYIKSMPPDDNLIPDEG